jgi:two-component system chemotaxis sensor kinase CheA
MLLIHNVEFIHGFIEEATSHLENLGSGLLQLENQANDQKFIDGLFRAVHSIKGTAGFFGLKKIVSLAHATESVFAAIKSRKLPIDKKLVNTLLGAVDALQALVGNLPEEETLDITTNLQELTVAFDLPKQVELSPSPDNTIPELYETDLQQYRIRIADSEKQFIEEKLRYGHQLYLIRLGLNTDLGMNHLNPVEFFKKIEAIGNIVISHSDYSEIKGIDELPSLSDSDIYCTVVFTSILEKDLLPNALEIPETKIVQLNASRNPSIPPPAVHSFKIQEPMQHEVSKPVRDQNSVKTSFNDPAGSKSSTGVFEDSVRVHVSLLNSLLNLAGEMVLGRNQLLRAMEKHRKNIPGMESILQNMDRITTEMQDKVMQTRMQPVGNVFNKFPRIIHDLSQNLGKDIELKQEGGEVELDKSIIEALADPLTHLVRNAADHGLESSEVREKVGKYRAGTIIMKAYHEGGYVCIDVTDDGAGIDFEKVKHHAVENGLATEPEIIAMSEQQLVQLLFKPGFSTAKKITDYSGRGVGMDVVKTNIEKLGGTIEVFTETGKGSTFKLLLPLTLAIIPSLIVEVERQKFALPQVNLEEIVRIKPGDTVHKLEFIHDSEVLRLRGHLLPVIHLADVLGLQRTYLDPATGERKIDRRMALRDQRYESPEVSQDVQAAQTSGTAVVPDILQYRREISSNIIRILVIKSGSYRYGIAVDVIHDGEEILVKSLPSFIKDCKCYSGVTILGDGRVAMILDAVGIVEKADLKFIEEQDGKTSVKDQVVDEFHEQQNLLLFNCSGPETFGINMALVSRVDTIKDNQIEKIGDLDYIKFGEDSLRVLRPEDFLAVGKRPVKDTHYIIIPKLVSHPMGILIEHIIDTVQVSIHLNEEAIKAKGLLGSTILNNKIVLILNLYELFEMADPVHYSMKDFEMISFEKTLLLVEDTPFFLKMECSYLEAAGYKVLTATNGKEALQIMQEQRVDGVVSDILMPVMDGIELVKKIREDKQLAHLPVIALTSLDGEAQTKAGLDAGFDYYEYKLDRGRLLEKVGLALQKKKEAV